MEYEWDEAKAAANLTKHGVSFTAAARALEDPFRLEFIDNRLNYGEERIQTLCSDRGRVLFIVTVMRDENVCRIVSARKATRYEQESYFKNRSLYS